jgi:hypothetical protein
LKQLTNEVILSPPPAVGVSDNKIEEAVPASWDEVQLAALGFGCARDKARSSGKRRAWVMALGMDGAGIISRLPIGLYRVGIHALPLLAFAARRTAF